MSETPDPKQVPFAGNKALSLLLYLKEQFPATVGHMPLVEKLASIEDDLRRQHFNEQPLRQRIESAENVCIEWAASYKKSQDENQLLREQLNKLVEAAGKVSFPLSVGFHASTRDILALNDLLTSLKTGQRK